MHIQELDFDFPSNLIATRPLRPSRVLLNQSDLCKELSIKTLLGLFQKGDVLVINESKVIKRRLFCQVLKADGTKSNKSLEVLFLKDLGEKRWQVLFPVSRLKAQQDLLLPGGVQAKVVVRGKPQILFLDTFIDSAYFSQYGEMPLPPYIQKERNERHNIDADSSWYQTDWAQVEGSTAAPTASLHFSNSDLELLQEKGVKILKLVLHIGLGTFLPLEVENLEQHQMHTEYVEISKSVWQQVKKANRVWALGTTVARSLESCARNILQEQEERFFGETDLFISPGYEYKVVDILMTNFHQPKSTLLALVMAFAGKENVKQSYEWAIKNEFRLFSYGDLSVWM